MNLDTRVLQPTNNTVVSYNILGMADLDTLPAWRLTSNNPSASVLNNFLALAKSACQGLMRNNTAITQLKVWHVLMRAFSQKVLCMCAVQNFAQDPHSRSCEGA